MNNESCSNPSYLASEKHSLDSGTGLPADKPRDITMVYTWVYFRPLQCLVSQLKIYSTTYTQSSIRVSEQRCHPRQLLPRGRLQLDLNHLDQLQTLDDPLGLLLDLDLRLDRRNREYLSELVPVRVVVELRPSLRSMSNPQ